MKSIHFLAVALIALSAGALAQTSTSDTGQASAAASTIKGVVRKVDKDAGKITISHEPLVILGMPAMTMVFRAADPKFLVALKEGDKVNFVADRVDGQYVVTKIQRTK